MVDPLVSGALVWLGQRLLDKGFDRVLDAAFDSLRPPAVAPRRHDLSVNGAQGTSDLDVGIHFHGAESRSPVILTFQKFGTTAGGVTFPMVLGDTAHLTLRRDHYLVAALVVTLPSRSDARPTLRGVGWTHEWVADNHVREVAITTQHPTEALVKELGLMKGDGSCPFALPAARTSSLLEHVRRTLSELLPAAGQQQSETPSPRAGPDAISALLVDVCRARTAPPNVRCQSAVWADKLCRAHWQQTHSGHTIYDYRTGERRFTRPDH